MMRWLCYGVTRRFLIPIAFLSALVFPAAAASGIASVPPAIAAMRNFRGTISYVARRDGEPAADTVTGTLSVGDHSWTLDERAQTYSLHASNNGSYMVRSSGSGIVDDIFEAEGLANGWAATVGVIATQNGALDGSAAWLSTAGVRVYTDASGEHLIGIADQRGRNHISYSFDGFTTAGSLSAPSRILRLRGGKPEVVFSIASYLVARGTAQTGAVRIDNPLRPFSHTNAPMTLLPGPLPAPFTAIRLQVAALASFLVAALFIALWMHRHMLILTLCKRLALDPRGWRRAGISVFVGPDGVLSFDGMKYRVGPHFYNRAALVQCSALFVRVSAPGVPRAVILPRRFRPLDLGIRVQRRRHQAAGFTLLEVMLATSLFAAVVLLAVYPAVAALSRAAELARERSQAAVIAANALADEEAAYAYASAGTVGRTQTSIDGFTVTVSLTPAAAPRVANLSISVAKADGSVLAVLQSLVGPPVNVPAAGGGAP